MTCLPVDAIRLLRPRLLQPGARIVLASALAGLMAHTAVAEEASGGGPGLMERQTLTGDWGGARTWLAEHGAVLTMTQTSDVLGNPTGGFRQGIAYDGVFAAGLHVDLEKAVGWQGGSFRASGYAIQGHGLSQYYVGNYLTVTTVETTDYTRLDELWVQQSLFDDRLAVKVGQIEADNSFITSPTADLFVNSAFGFPGSFSYDIPDGGPTYPYAVPGVQVAMKPDPAWTLQGAVFNGNPLGSGSNWNGLAFPLGDGVFAIAEVAYAFTPAAGSDLLPGTYKVGGWYNSESFDNLSMASNGVSLASPLSSGTPMQESGTYALYGLIDQTLWREPGTTGQGLSGFSHLALSPQPDRNLMTWYFDLGLAYTGLLPGRDADVAGIAFGYANMSPALADLARARNAATGLNGPIPDFEAVLEVTYKAAATPWLSVQPFAQYIFHPGGNGPNPENPEVAIKDAAVLGLRAAVTF